MVDNPQPAGRSFDPHRCMRIKGELQGLGTGVRRRVEVDLRDPQPAEAVAALQRINPRADPLPVVGTRSASLGSNLSLPHPNQRLSATGSTAGHVNLHRVGFVSDRAAS
jgi:hypothetical protein